MTTLKEKVLKSLEKSNQKVTRYYAENSEARIMELNQGIEDLAEESIYPQFKVLEDELFEIDFITQEVANSITSTDTTRMTEKVIKVFERTNDEVVSYYLTNSEAGIMELNRALVELSNKGIITNVVKLNKELMELKFSNIA